METKQSRMGWLDRFINKFTPQQQLLKTYKKQNDEFRELVHSLEEKVRMLEGNTDNSDLTDIDMNNIDPDELVFPDSFERVVATIPEGWFVFEAAQSPTTEQWYCHLVEFSSMFPDDDEDEQDVANVRRIDSGEHLTLTSAVNACLRKLEAGEITTYE